EGTDAIQVSRGRKSYRLHADRQKYLANKELKARLTYLEAENAYLKKVYSLIQEKSRRTKKE
ncbi:MAG: helix-turn-helix domain-containing protein, partial [Bacilli bacterium]